MKRLIFLMAIAILLFSCKDKLDIAIEEHYKSVLKDPSSFKIYEMSVVEDDGVKVWVKLDYGAKNSFGAMGRETEYLLIIGSEVLETANEYNFEEMRERYQESNESNTVYE